MKLFSAARLHRSFAFGVLALLALLMHAPDAIAEAPVARSTVVEIPARKLSEARIVDVYRDHTPTQFAWRAENGDFEPIAYRDVVRVKVEVTAPTIGSFEGDDGVSFVSMFLQPDSLTPGQRTALGERRTLKRVRAFHLSKIRATKHEHHIDSERSQLCNRDSVVCNDFIAYKDELTDVVQLSVE